MTMIAAIKPVFGYLRVSGKGQLDGDGFPRQREAIERWCNANNARVIRWFTEEGVSGTVDSLERPAYGEMLRFAGPVTAMTIVAESASRLARDLMVSELLVQEAKRQGIEIYEAVSGMELSQSDDPTRVMIRQMLGVVSQWQKTMLVRQLRAARERKKKLTGRCEGSVSWVEQGKFPALAAKLRGYRGLDFTVEETREALNLLQFNTPMGKKYWTHGSAAQAMKSVKEFDARQRMKRVSTDVGVKELPINI